MNTRDIRFFLKVYECESINLAADQLFITPQGLSNVISKLEKELGAELFVRSRAGTYPTASGKAFREHAVKMIDHYEDGLRELEEIRQQQEGSVRLGYAFGALRGLATDVPLRFQELNQQYRVEYMELPDLTVEEFVVRGELDIGFTASCDFNKCDAIKMYEEQIFFVAHDESRFYDRESVSVSEICEEPLTLRNDNFATTHIILDEWEKRGATPSVLMRTGGILRSLVLCAEQRVNTIILEHVMKEFNYQNLRAIPFKEDLKWPLYMITRKGRTRSKGVQDYIDYIAEYQTQKLL